MISRQVVNPSLGFILIISFYHILIFNVESVDLSPDAGQALHGVDDSSRDRISQEINQNYSQKLRVLPKRSTVFSIFQVFAGVVVVVAISLLIVRCMKSLKSVDHKKSSRRLATAADPCGSGGPEEGATALEGLGYEELGGIILEWATKLEAEAGKPNDREGTNQQRQALSVKWNQSVVEEATKAMDKTDYDPNLTEDQVEEVRTKREILFDDKVVLLLNDADASLAIVSADRILKVAERAERFFGIHLTILKSIMLKIKERQAFNLRESVDYLGPLRDVLNTKPSFLYMDYRAYLRDAPNMLKALHMYNKQLLKHERKLRRYLDRMNLPDAELLNEESSDEESSDEELFDFSDED